MKKLLIFSFLLIAFSSCELLEDAAESENRPNIAEGLKEALRVGTDTATRKLAVVDGYLRDQAVKILLPDQLEEQINAFKAFEINVFGLGTVTGQRIYDQGLVIDGVVNISSLASVEDDLITGINRAAESAASEAGPIFFDAITGITISDAENILYGPEDAATMYLKDNTFQSLFDTYEPKVNDAVNSVTVGEQTVEEVYAKFVNDYNDILNTRVPVSLLERTTIGSLTNLSTITSADISEHATQKGLDGLFLKVEEEEASIRENPLARVTEILQEVFGLLDQ